MSIWVVAFWCLERQQGRPVRPADRARRRRMGCGNAVAAQAQRAPQLRHRPDRIRQSEESVTNNRLMFLPGTNYVEPAINVTELSGRSLTLNES